MNWRIFRRMLRDPELTPAAKIVCLVILDRANSRGVCWLNNHQIAQESCLSRNTVTVALKSLVGRKYIIEQNIAAGDELPSGKIASQPQTIIHINHAQKLCKACTKIVHPCIDPPSDPLKKTAEQCSKLIDVTSKSSLDYNIPIECSLRYRRLWGLFRSIKFVKKNGNLATVLESVANPEILCTALCSRKYSTINLEHQMNIAAAWTAEQKKNRRDRLGVFLRNWFDNAVKSAESQPSVNAAMPYHREL